MSENTFSTTGIGIRISDLNHFADKEKVFAMIKANYELYKRQSMWTEFLKDFEDTAREGKDLMQRCSLALEEGSLFHAIGLSDVIANTMYENYGINFTTCFDGDCDEFVLYSPGYPWRMTNAEKELSEKDIIALFRKFILSISKEGTDVNDPKFPYIDYHEIENIYY